MWKISNSINHYLSDNRRFADLFNGICFQGKTVVRAEELSDTSQVYYSITGMSVKDQAARRTGKSETYLKRKERTRDICKQLKNGEEKPTGASEKHSKADKRNQEDGSNCTGIYDMSIPRHGDMGWTKVACRNDGLWE